MKLEISKNNCAGCMTCVLMCSFKHHGASSPLLSCIRIHGDEARADFTPKACVQCDSRDCVNSCPAGALSVEPVTGATIVDHDACTLCEICVSVCNYDGVHKVTDLNGAEKIEICDMCGGDPQCAAYCRMKAVKAV